MALGKKSGGRNFRPGQGGRKKGSRDKIPRTFKASVKAIYEEIASNDPGIIRRAIVRGLSAPPPKSFPYVQLGAHYLDGKPTEPKEPDQFEEDLASFLANAHRLRADSRAVPLEPGDEYLILDARRRGWIEEEDVPRMLAELRKRAQEPIQPAPAPHQPPGETEPVKRAETATNLEAIVPPSPPTDPDRDKPAPSRPQRPSASSPTPSQDSGRVWFPDERPL